MRKKEHFFFHILIYKEDFLFHTLLRKNEIIGFIFSFISSTLLVVQISKVFAPHFGTPVLWLSHRNYGL